MLDLEALVVLIFGTLEPFRLCLLLLITEVPVDEIDDLWADFFLLYSLKFMH